MTYRHRIVWTGRSVFWGYVAALGAFIRAAAYWWNPPGPDALSSQTFESILPYTTWAWLLFVLGAVLTLATACRQVLPTALPAMLSHLLLVMLYLIFTYNLVVGALRTDESWAGIFPLFVIALISGERVRELGFIVRVEIALRRYPHDEEDA